MRSIGLTFFFFFLSLGGMLWAQPKALTKEESFSFDAENDVTKALVQAETEKSVSLQIEFKGFNKKDKEYKITAKILNSIKTPMKEFEPVTIDLDARSGVADFLFTFTQKPGIKYSPEGIESKFIEFSVIDKNGAGNLPGLESLGLSSKKFLFRFQKKWRVKVVGQEVVVKLTPYKSAASIGQN